MRQATAACSASSTAPTSHCAGVSAGRSDRRAAASRALRAAPRRAVTARVTAKRRASRAAAAGGPRRIAGPDSGRRLARRPRAWPQLRGRGAADAQRRLRVRGAGARRAGAPARGDGSHPERGRQHGCGQVHAADAQRVRVRARPPAPLVPAHGRRPSAPCRRGRTRRFAVPAPLCACLAGWSALAPPPLATGADPASLRCRTQTANHAAAATSAAHVECCAARADQHPVSHSHHMSPLPASRARALLLRRWRSRPRPAFGCPRRPPAPQGTPPAERPARLNTTRPMRKSPGSSPDRKRAANQGSAYRPRLYSACARPGRLGGGRLAPGSARTGSPSRRQGAQGWAAQRLRALRAPPWAGEQRGARALLQGRQVLLPGVAGSARSGALSRYHCDCT